MNAIVFEQQRPLESVLRKKNSSKHPSPGNLFSLEMINLLPVLQYYVCGFLLQDCPFHNIYYYYHYHDNYNYNS